MLGDKALRCRRERLATMGLKSRDGTAFFTSALTISLIASDYIGN
jgi:hypothetical protein